MSTLLLTRAQLDDADELLRLALEGVPLFASAAERPCEMYRDHGSATPAVTQGHHVYPIYLQNRKHGKIVDGTLRFLCGSCHDSTHAWLYWIMGERRIPNPEPPPRAKALAVKALDWYLGPTTP